MNYSDYLLAMRASVAKKKMLTGVGTFARDFHLQFRVFLGLVFITTYFYFGSKYYYDGVNKALGIIAFTAMLVTQAAGLILYTRHFKSLTRTGGLLSVPALILLMVFQAVNLFAAGAGKEITFSLFNLEVTLSGTATVIDVVLPGIIFVLLIAFILFYAKRNHFPVQLNPDWSVYLLSILYLLGFIFLWNPLSVYASYPSNFDFTAFDILKNNLGGFLIAAALLTVTYFSFSNRIRNALLITATSGVVIGFIHNTIVPIEMGTLQEAVFLNQEHLAKPVALFIAECAGILFTVHGIIWLFRKGVHKQIRYVLIALNVILITQGLVAAGSSGSFFQKQNIPSNPTSSVSFSKEGENIVLLVLDMFHGWYVNKIVEEDPALKNIFKGFVWYPNTLSVSSITGSSIGAMLGGYQYTIDKLNQDTDRPLSEKITDIAAELNTELNNEGYGFSGNRIIYSTVDSLDYDTFLPKWHEDWDKFNSTLNIGLHKEINYDLLWNNAAFYSAPLIFKPRIYNKGKWLLGRIKKNQNTSRTKPYNFLRLLPHISDTESSRSNFIYLYGSATHHPWDIIDEDGVLHTDVSPYENNKWALETLSSWIEWMKNNEVYDNTKIIIVSDHGPHWWYYKGKVDTDTPVIMNTEVERINELSMGLFALLLVKDFDKTGGLEENWRFMSNADVHSIIFDEENPATKEPPLMRTLPSSVVLWERKLWELNQLRIIKEFEVTDNMYDLNNWKIVD